MKIVWHKNFEKHYKKRVLPYKNINLKYQERIRLFIKNQQDPVLKDHQLTGKMRLYRSFWIAGDIRVTYRIENGVFNFYDVGSHNQVYRN